MELDKTKREITMSNKNENFDEKSWSEFAANATCLNEGTHQLELNREFLLNSICQYGGPYHKIDQVLKNETSSTISSIEMLLTWYINHLNVKIVPKFEYFEKVATMLTVASIGGFLSAFTMSKDADTIINFEYEFSFFVATLFFAGCGYFIKRNLWKHHSKLRVAEQFLSFIRKMNQDEPKDWR